MAVSATSKGSTIQAPLVEKTADEKGQTTQAWTEFFQAISTKLNNLTVGVTDGSDAAAGDIGEYMTATGSVTLASNTANAPTSLTLTAGDWDVGGNATFHVTSAATSHFAAGIDGTTGSEFIATIPTGTGTQRLVAQTVRRNVTADTTAQLVVVATFTSGAVSADGTIWARRAR
jgi:hypothetical protein